MAPITAQENYLFVYGTLRRGRAGGAAPHPMHRVVATHCSYVGLASCQGKLYELGGYPGLVLTNRPGARVRGEIYRVLHPDALWPVLDHYEDCDPACIESEYTRERIPVVTATGQTLTAWAYLYNRPVRGKRAIASGDYNRFE